MFFLVMYVLQRVTNDVCIPKSHDLIIFYLFGFLYLLYSVFFFQFIYLHGKRT